MKERQVKILVQRQDSRILSVPCEKEETYHDWEIPQGVVQEGETDEDAVERILKTKTGCQTQAIVFLFEDEQDGMKTICYDVTWNWKDYQRKKRRGEDVPKIEWQKPEVLTQGPDGDFNFKMFNFMGIDFTLAVDDVMAI